MMALTTTSQAEYALMEARRLNMALAAAKQREAKAAKAAAAAAAGDHLPESDAPLAPEGEENPPQEGQEGG